MLPGGAHLEVAIREANLIQTARHGRDMPRQYEQKTSSSHKHLRENGEQSARSVRTIGCARRTGSVGPRISVSFFGHVRHVARSQSHRDDPTMKADLSDEPADEGRAQFVEARPITAC